MPNLTRAQAFGVTIGSALALIAAGFITNSAEAYCPPGAIGCSGDTFRKGTYSRPTNIRVTPTPMGGYRINDMNGGGQIRVTPTPMGGYRIYNPGF